MSRRLEITVSEGLWDRLDEARGHEPRASFVKRALEKALGAEGKGRVESPAVGGTAAAGGVDAVRAAVPDSSAPSRASVPRVPGLVSASAFVKQGVRPIPKGGK